MVAWRTAFLVCLVFSLATLVQRGYGDLDDFNLEDALKETSSVKRSNFGLTDALSDGNDGRQKPSTGGRGRWDHVTTTTTRRPGTTRAPSNPVEPDGLNLADALDDQNVIDGRKKPNVGEGGGLSDKDLEDILGGGGYKPDKNKGGGGYGSNDDPGSGMSTETGTIAGVASALAMALIGAVSSYISYQQKKFCFSIQQGLNADYVKGENLEAVVCEEPQVTYSKQEMQSAEPPPPEPPRI
ncbi:CD99 antigen-like protein 2 isoform X4 [Peromyscus californicus insignis]|uniref:CD99 antigen-like protein 2 isoform X4 n=1 Tax=Peromyscus californicus insignis TaxID=564181 RepID=UPI0022A7E3BC|nr:CD99 antigen-like protein 2 isoform X4 [Peromyscus californicus insignis]